MKSWAQSKVVQACEKQVTNPELCEVGPSSVTKSRRSLVKSLLHPMDAMSENSSNADQQGA